MTIYNSWIYSWVHWLKKVNLYGLSAEAENTALFSCKKDDTVIVLFEALVHVYMVSCASCFSVSAVWSS